MTLFDYYLQYMTQVWEGKRPAPEGITLPEDGDEAARIQALGRQLQAMGMADFVRACAAQDGTVLPEELFVTESSDLGGFQVFLQGAETPEAAPETPTEPEAPAQPPEPDPDAGKHAFEVFLDCIATSRIEGYPTDKLAEFLIGSYGSAISECIETGDVTRDFTRLLEEDTDYCAVAFGYLGGYPTTDIVVVPFHTPGGELKPQDCTFSSTVADITLQGATITIKPSNPATPYFWQVYNTTLIESYRKGAGVAQLMADGLAIIAEALSEQAGIEITPEKAAGMVTKTGNDSFVYTTLDPATEYCVMAVGLDNKARQTTEVYISQPFKTLAPGGDVFAPMECTITVNGMTDDGLSVTVSPADKQMTYVGMAGEAEYYAEFASDAEYLTDDLLLWTEMAAGEQMSLVELLTEYGFFLQGDQTYIFPENFTPGNLYLAYTYGLNQQGEVTAGMQKTFFTIDEQGKAHPAAAPAVSNVRKLHRSDLHLAAYSYIPDATRPASPFLNAWTNIAPKRTVGLFE